MNYSGPIDLNALIDLDSIAGDGTYPYTFFAFPISTLNEYGIPSDPEAQEYIAAVQAAGVPIGIWLNSPIDGTGYAAITQENILQLHNAIAGLTQFSDSYAATLCEKFFREAGSGPS